MDYLMLWEFIAERIGVNPNVLSPMDIIDELTDRECRELALASLLYVE
jgi:hypothetical protein